ncbi:MAG: hypothetical protein LV473_05900 [Nitrospira sp.]|nr:hypothetical protein [Nitrospira sp.]
MLAKKRRLILISFSLIASVTGGILFAAAMSIGDLLKGGFDAVIQGWKNNGAESSNWKWALASVPLCFWAGVFIWRWFMLRTGLLTKEEMDEAWGNHQSNRS